MDYDLHIVEQRVGIEKSTVEEPVEIFTINGVYASFEENIKGTLETGKLADVVVLFQEISEIAEKNKRCRSFSNNY